MPSNASPDAPRDVAGTPFRLAVHDSIEAAETPWRALERTGVLTPYQRYDWITALRAGRKRHRDRCAVAVVHDAAGPAALLPLAIGRRFGLRVAAIIGSDVANADWLIVRQDAAPHFTAAVLARRVAASGPDAGGFDGLVLATLPPRWQGLANPLLAIPHQPAPDPLYLAPVTPAGETGRLSARQRRNILRGKRRLEETVGPVTLRRADGAGEIAAVHAAFLAQRAARFAQMGVPNVFAEDWCVAFFRNAAATAPGSERPAMRLHALWAGDSILATSCGTCAGPHYSQYINSTASGPAARYSLIGILMHELLPELAAAGITSIDMGLGDFPYKADWTDRQDAYDAAIGLTPAGRLAGAAIMGLRALKRRIKHNPRLFGAFKRVRALAVAARRPRAGAPAQPRGGAE